MVCVRTGFRVFIFERISSSRLWTWYTFKYEICQKIFTLAFITVHARTYFHGFILVLSIDSFSLSRTIFSNPFGSQPTTQDKHQASGYDRPFSKNTRQLVSLTEALLFSHVLGPVFLSRIIFLAIVHIQKFYEYAHDHALLFSNINIIVHRYFTFLLKTYLFQFLYWKPT